MQDKILNVVLGGLIFNKKILLIKRENPPYKGYWGLPGGKIKFGENIEKAALREIEEETGIKSKFVGLKGIASEVLYNKNKKKAHFLLFVCELKPRSLIENGNWFEIENIKKFKDIIIPSDFIMIEKFLLKNNSIPIYKIKMVENGKKYFMEKFEK